MATKLSKTLHLSKTVFLFFLLFLAFGCQSETVVKKEMADDPENSEQATSTIKVFVPTDAKGLPSPTEYPFSKTDLSLEEKVGEVLHFMATFDPQNSENTYRKKIKCSYRFQNKSIIYLECLETQNGQIGFAEEQIILLSILKSLFEIKDIESVRFIQKQKQAEIFIRDLILPNVIDRDFMKMLERNLVSRN